MPIGRGILVLSTFLVAAAANAQFPDQVIDQMQPRIDATRGGAAIGGNSEQMLAQTLTVGLDGDMIAVFLPLACDSGRLVLEVRDVVGDLPGTTVLVRRTVRASALPYVGIRFRRISLGRPLAVVAGQRLSLVLSNPTGACGIFGGPDGDSYPGGGAFFDSRPNPPGWVPIFSPEFELPFMQVVVPSN